MTYMSAAAADFFSDFARVQDIVSKLTTIRERLPLLADSPDARDERSRFYNDLCELYDGIGASNDHSFESLNATIVDDEGIVAKNLCASIDSLLDQLASVDVRNRLWFVKAGLAFDQISDLANIETLRLQSAVIANEQASQPFEKTSALSGGVEWTRQQLAA